MLKAYRIPAILLALGVWTTTAACASRTYAYRNTGYQYQQFERRAYDNGYREGLEHGRDDARSGRQFSYTRHDEYRDADEGYHRSDGNKDVYRQAYRDGFRAGYMEAFNQVAGRAVVPGGIAVPRRAPYPSGGPDVVRPGIYTSPAAATGYRDGFDVGHDDARDHESYDPVRSRKYRSADHDYDRSLDPKDEYKREYRRAFEQGYADGYGSVR